MRVHGSKVTGQDETDVRSLTTASFGNAPMGVIRLKQLAGKGRWDLGDSRAGRRSAPRGKIGQRRVGRGTSTVDISTGPPGRLFHRLRRQENEIEEEVTRESDRGV